MLEGIPNVKYHDPFDKIKRATVISFDVFDTAILRPFLHHHDMYFILEKYLNVPKFHNVRIDAEKKARKNIVERGIKEDINLLDIYENININVQKAINTEIAIDVSICCQRAYVYKLYQFAINLGKRVIFASDITYPHKAMVDILHKNGYNRYHALYISSEEMLSKAKGGLYKRIIEDLDINPNRILHIGDSINADIQQAKLHGLQTLYMPRPYHELTKVLNPKQYTLRTNAINSAIFACAANVMLNNPTGEVSRKSLITMPVCYNVVQNMIQNHDDKPIVAIIHSNHSNTIFHTCHTIYHKLHNQNIQFRELNINHIYAASIITFVDLQTLSKALPTTDFLTFLHECYNISTTNTQELLLSWHTIEMKSLDFRQQVIEKLSGIQDFTVYDFTFEEHIQTTLQKILNNTIAKYYNAQKIILNAIDKITKPSFFIKPNANKILVEMQSLTNEEAQRYIMPQITQLADKLGQYLNKLQ
jgi:HAD superfamily hydrolase (TIGR01549 family)